MKFNPKHNAFTASRFLTWQVGRRWNVGSHVGLSISSLVSAGSASWTRTQGTVAFWVLVWGIAFLFVSSGCEQMLWSFVWNPLIFLGLLSHLYGSKVKFIQLKKSNWSWEKSTHCFEYQHPLSAVFPFFPLQRQHLSNIFTDPLVFACVSLIIFLYYFLLF